MRSLLVLLMPCDLRSVHSKWRLLAFLQWRQRSHVCSVPCLNAMSRSQAQMAWKKPWTVVKNPRHPPGGSQGGIMVEQTQCSHHQDPALLLQLGAFWARKLWHSLVYFLCCKYLENMEYDGHVKISDFKWSSKYSKMHQQGKTSPECDHNVLKWICHQKYTKLAEKKKVLINEVIHLFNQTWHSGLYLHIYSTEKTLWQSPQHKNVIKSGNLKFQFTAWETSPKGVKRQRGETNR